ncbi:hypothetical protein ACWG0P_10980 [Amedibacillus sp. YH-ame6]
MNEKYLLWFYLKNRIKKETNPINENINNIEIVDDLSSSESQPNSEESMGSASEDIANGEHIESTKNKMEIVIMVGLVISLLLYLILTITMLFCGDKFLAQVLYFISVVFMTIMLTVMYLYDRYTRRKNVDNLLIKYIENMQYLQKSFEYIGVDTPGIYDHVISIIDKKLIDMNKMREKILSYTGKFLTFVFFPIVAFVFGNFKIDWRGVTAKGLISILTSLLVFAIGIFVFYMIFLILVNMKWQKESDIERMKNDLTWIKIKLSQLSE